MRRFSITITSNRLRLLISFALWALALIWFVVEWRNPLRTVFPFEPLLAFIGGFIPFLEIDSKDSKVEEGPQYELGTTLDKQNRANMLTLMRHIWVDEFLVQALDDSVWLDLNKRELPHTIERPHMLLRVPQREEPKVPVGTSLRDLFEERGRSLLILGAPGSGKSVTLAELCAELLDGAEADPEYPLPALLNLTSWDGKESLSAWLERRLMREYTLPNAVSRTWLQNGRLILLLDGLDEVEASRREACVSAINNYRNDRTMPCVVCSRLAEYEALQTRLQMGSALLIEPLDDKQIDSFLEPQQLVGVRAVLDTDGELRKLARQPLFLNILANAFYTMTQSAVLTDWLEGRLWRLYRLAIGIVVGLLTGLIAGPSFGLALSFFENPDKDILLGYFLSVGAGLFLGFIYGMADRPLSNIVFVDVVTINRPRWRDIKHVLKRSLGGAIAIGLSFLIVGMDFDAFQFADAVRFSLGMQIK